MAGSRDFVRSFGRCIAAAVLCAGLTFARPARADLADKAYDDIKQLVEELITAEVAESVVPNVVCRAPALLDHYPRSLQRIFDRQFGSLRASLQDETAVLVAYYVFAVASEQIPVDKFPNQTLLPTVKAATGPASAPDGECSSAAVLEKRKSSIQECVKHVRAKCLEKHEYATDDGLGLAAQCSNPGKEAPAHRMACSLAFAAQASLQGKPEQAEAQLHQALSAIITHLSATALSAEPTPAAIDEVTVRIRDLLVSATPPETGDLTEGIAKALGKGADPSAPKKLEEIAKAAARLRTQWMMLAAGRSQWDFATVFQVVGGEGGAIDALCARAGADPTCARFRMMRAEFRFGERMYPLFRAIQRKDYREIAMLSIRDLFERARNGTAEEKDEEKTRLFNLYAHFSESVAVYVLDVASEGEPTVGSRAAFKEAAFKVVRESLSEKGSGFDRSGFVKIFIPDFAMRYTYSSSLINQGSGDGFRFAPTVDALIFRKRLKYTESVYVAAQVSLVDLAGPFSEMALRRNENYSNNYLVWGQFVRPRAEVLLGVPPLSTRLALSVGVSVRATTAIRSLDPTANVYTYRWITDGSDVNYQADPFRFAEMSVALKYVP